MAKIYFHSAPLRLGPGSIILPGNWGRILRAYHPPFEGSSGLGNPWVLAREVIFDQMRERMWPRKPSRFYACFAIEDEQAARRYRANHDPRGVFHVVEIVDETKRRHEGPLRYVSLQNVEFLKNTSGFAAAYWNGQPEGDMEVVTSSSLRVVEPLDW